MSALSQERTAILSGVLKESDIRQIEDTVAAGSKLAYDRDGVRISERTNP